MRKISKTALLAGALALTLGGCVAPSGGSSGGSGGAPQVGDNGTNDSCYSQFAPPDTGIGLGASIKGSVQLFCKIPPQTHHLEIRLQREVNGAWTDQNRRQWDDIPPTIPFFRFTTAPCVPGSWRVVYSTWGTSATGKPFQNDGRTSMTKKVEPHDCG